MQMRDRRDLPQGLVRLKSDGTAVDKDAPIEQTLDFNYQVFAEDIEIVESQYPEDLPLNLHDEAHFDRSSVTYRKGLAALGFGRQFTA